MSMELVTILSKLGCNLLRGERIYLTKFQQDILVGFHEIPGISLTFRHLLGEKSVVWVVATLTWDIMTSIIGNTK